MDEPFESVNDCSSLNVLLNDNRSNCEMDHSRAASATSSYESGESDKRVNLNLRRQASIESDIRKAILPHLEKERRKSGFNRKRSVKERNIRIKRVQHSAGYVYILKTLFQSTAKRPSYAALVDECQERSVPVAVQAPTDFVQEMTAATQIAQTSHTRSCFACGGSGREFCKKCPRTKDIVCTWCYRRLLVPCSTCHSRGNLMHFISQLYKWHTKTDTSIHSPGNLLSEKDLLFATGLTMFDETSDRTSPLSHKSLACEEAIKFSEEAHGRLNELPPNVSIVRQQQTVIGIEVQLVEISYKGATGTYAIFGEEKNVKTVVNAFTGWRKNFDFKRIGRVLHVV